MKRFFMIVLFILIGGCVNNKKTISPANNTINFTVALINGEQENPYCAGVWVSQRNIITAYHCVKDEVGSEIIYYNVYDDNTVYEAKIKRLLFMSDLALLEVQDDFPSHPWAKIGKSPEIGEKVDIMGHPGGLSYTYTVGYISSYRQNTFLPAISIIQISAPIFFGNSGGGAFNSKGELIGIASFIASVPNVGFFIGSEDINILMDLVNPNYVIP